MVSYEAIADVQFLALLGEPGIGKSYAMEAAHHALKAMIHAKSDQVLRIDLRSCGSEQRLIQKVFEDRVFRDWVEGNHRLHLFLDSLDECLMRVSTVAALLLEELPHFPCERLVLRIACRTADWPILLEDGIRQMWGKEASRILELVPLLRRDVMEAAKANQIAPDAFLQAVDHANVVPLAIKPVTLKMLLNVYGQNSNLPDSLADLYQDAMRLLCEETSDSRRAARLTGRLSADQRMIVAARIAAVTQFARQYAVFTEPSIRDVPESTVAIREICGGKEAASGTHFDITEEAVRETLATGLFSARGQGLLGWAHQTYAEFLAAWYVSERGMPTEQIKSLIFHPQDAEQHLVPQLQETAAWISGRNHTIFREIMNSDPQALLKSDVAKADTKDRVDLTEALLDLCGREKLLPRDIPNQKQLCHPALPDQLRPYLVDKGRDRTSRWAAIDFAESCECKELQDELADVALDVSEDTNLRIQAAYAVTRVAEESTKFRLLPLACGMAGDDPDDELKGCGLMAVWPLHITADKLFGLLTRPKSELFGSYYGFLHRGFLEHLECEDLLVALAWVEQQIPDEMSLHPFAEAMHQILLLAWDRLHEAGVLEAFARVAWKRLCDHDAVMGSRSDKDKQSSLYEDEGKRRLLVTAIVPHVTNPDANAVNLVFSPTPLLFARDIPWLINQITSAPNKHDGNVYTKLLSPVFSWNDLSHIENILCACLENPLVTMEYKWLVEPVPLDSPHAELMRRHWKEQEGWELKRQQRLDVKPIVDPPPLDRILTRLKAFEDGDLNAWWTMNADMTLESDSLTYGTVTNSNLTSMPGWRDASVETRYRIIAAAEKYVCEQTPDPVQWVGTNILHFPDMAGYRAIDLLTRERPEAIVSFTAEVWKKWAPVVLAYPILRIYVKSWAFRVADFLPIIWA